MNQTERYYRIDQLVRERGPISREDLMAALEVSRATLTRDLNYMRDRLHAPIVFDREAGGYRFEQAGGGPPYEPKGPTAPKPGPTFPTQARALVSASTKGLPSITSATVHTTTRPT